jgi:DNA-binding response OmpR family regulator
MIKDVKILIVDDSAENLKVVSYFLKEKNYKIAIATDGESALKVAEKNDIDLILLDIMMPGIDGYEVCRRLKENNQTKNIPVIFLTARTESEDIVKGFKSGGVDYIMKPFNKEELFLRVDNHIRLKLTRDILVEWNLKVKNSGNHSYNSDTLNDLSKILNVF